MNRLLVALFALVPLAAGCLQGATLDPQGALPALDLATVAEPLWSDPQNAPHPAWGWPTLVNPAEGEGLPALWKPIPVAQMPDDVQGMAHLARAPEEVKTGGGIALFGSLAVVPGYGNPTAVLDISDPSAPVLLSLIENKEGARHRGAAFIAYPTGRLVFVVSTPVNVEVYDVTDPTEPRELPFLNVSRSHKVGVVPGTPFVYNANSRGATPNATFPESHMEGGKGQIEIFDLSDPDRPVLVQEFQNGYGCHHIYFWTSAEKQRAICAGIQYTQILDIADPRAPEVIVSIPVHHGDPRLPSTATPGILPGGVLPALPVSTTLSFSHFGILNDEGNVLIVGDETFGGGGYACDGPGYLGNIWFYDVENEKEPRLLGWFDPGPYFLDDPTLALDGLASCTAHHGRLVPTPEGKRDLLAMAFYGAGTVLVEFTDPARPRMVDQFKDHTNTWEVWYYNGHLFTGDLSRGLDVLTFT